MELGSEWTTGWRRTLVDVVDTLVFAPLVWVLSPHKFKDKNID